MAISPLGTIDYYERVLEHDPSAADDVRLIMFPGVHHCAGGPRPFYVNMLNEIDNWVDLRRKDGTIDSLFRHWIHGEGAAATEPRWSIVRDVLGWVE